MKKALITVGLGYGDEGKGTVVDYLTNLHGARLVVRYSGGPQAAHNVYVKDRHFCFQQLSSGSLAGADTLLTGDMRVNPLLLMREMEEFHHNFGYLPTVYIDEKLLVNTTFHALVNRIIEKRNNHGSCGLGVWHTSELVLLYIADLQDSILLRMKLEQMLDMARNYQKDYPDCDEKNELFNDRLMKEEIDALCSFYSNFIKNDKIRILKNDSIFELFNLHDTIVFEAAQGVLLDAFKGEMPHVSATRTTSEPAVEVVEKYIRYSNQYSQSPASVAKEIIGITRCYQTRHGNGHLSFEHEGLRPDGEDNNFNEFQKDFRVGELDFSNLKKAIKLNEGVDSIFVTCLDNNPFVLDTHRKLYGHQNIALEISDELGLKLNGISFGKDRSQKQYITYTEAKSFNLHDNGWKKEEKIHFL